MSKQEMILVHPTEVINELFPVAGFATGSSLEVNFADIATLEKKMDEGLAIQRRLVAETDPATRHLLPYVNLFRVQDGVLELFVYRRVKGIGEERLLGKCSIGIGGHINVSHVRFHDEHSKLDLGQTIMHNVMSELVEEVNIGDKPLIEYLLDENIRMQPSIYGYLNDESDEVGKRHLGVVMLMLLPSNYDPVCAEASAETIGFVPVSKLRDEIHGYDFENWSKLILSGLSDDFISDLTHAGIMAGEQLDQQRLELAQAQREAVEALDTLADDSDVVVEN